MADFLNQHSDSDEAMDRMDSSDNNDNDGRLVQSQPIFSSYEAQEFKTARDKFQEFLDIPLSRPFVAAPLATSSTGSRRPRFFDLHLHPALQLQKIVVVKDLPAQIAEVCRKRFISKHLLHLSAYSDFPFKDDPKKKQKKKSVGVVDERSLASLYHDLFGWPLSVLSSTLIFELSQWTPVLNYTLSVKEPAGSGLNFAVPDGFLCVTNEASENVLDNPSLSEGNKNDIKLILKHNLNRMALWEFKNLKAGSKIEMEKFVALAGDFTWSTCQADKNEQPSCVHHHRHNTNGHFTATGRIIGFDTDERELDLDAEQSVTIKPMDVYRLGHGDENITTSMEMDQDSDIVSSTVRNSSLAPGTSETASTSKEIHITAFPRGLAAKKSALISHPTSRGSSLKSEEMAKASKTTRDQKEKALDNKKPQKPHDIAQQLWAEGVKYDATFLVLNSGNHEIICLRHRQTQTLYISPVFEVVDKLYKATQIGLHALAYSDALNRARQLEALESPDNRTLIPRFYDLELHLEAFPPVYRPAGSQPIKNDAEAIYKELVKELNTKRTFMVKLPEANDYSTCPMARHQPATETLSSLSSSSNTSLSEASWSMVMGKAISERVYPITVHDDQNHSFSNKLVIKLARNKWDNINLDREYQRHCEHSSQTFGVKTFGVLTFPEGKHLTRGLLMEWSGETLKTILSKPKLQKQYNPQSIRATNALTILHDGGKLHGNLKAEHILLREGVDNNVSFISYGQKDLGDTSTPDMMQAAKEEEQDYMKSLY